MKSGFKTVTLLWYRCYYPHRSRDALSHVCGIFCLYQHFHQELIIIFHKLLININSTKEQDISEFRSNARVAHRLWQQTLGQYKVMTASVHLLLAHGHLYLQYAQQELKCANGQLSECTMEAGNGTNRTYKFRYSRKCSLIDERSDMVTRHLSMSDPCVVASEELQVVHAGRIRKSRGRRRKYFYQSL